jgi:hypothetical protein
MERVEQQQDSRYNTLSIVGFILAFIIPPVGFILGIIALSHINKTGEKGKGLAIAAIVLGAIFFLFLVLMVFIGISWIVIRNVVQNGDNSNGGKGQLDLNSMCLSTGVIATQVTNSTLLDYTVILRRDSGEDQIGGVKLVFTNDDEASSYVTDVSGNIETLMSKTASVNIPSGALSNPSKVSVVVYFLDASGNAQLCQTASVLTFA